ncbi:MAG: WD40 repeat domain-containing protein [Planctomycetota bacterium]
MSSANTTSNLSARRIRKIDSVANDTTLYYYNDNRQVLAESEVDGITQRWFIYGNPYLFTASRVDILDNRSLISTYCTSCYKGLEAQRLLFDCGFEIKETLMTDRYPTHYLDCRCAPGGIVRLCLMSALLMYPGSCKQRSGVSTPIRELQFDAQTVYVSTRANTLMATGYDIVSVWEWNYVDKEPQRTNIDDSWMPLWNSRRGPYPPNWNYTLMAPGRVICAAHREDDTSILVRNTNDEQELKRWSLGRRWFCNELRTSRNGKYIAILLQEDYDFVLRDEGRKDKGRHRLGVMDTQSGEIQWVTTIYQKEILVPNFYRVAASEDGRYLAGVGGTRGGGLLHLADVTQKKVLWEKVPRGEAVPIGEWTVNFNALCFSPDAKHIYVGGNMGLFCFDVPTGKILSQWAVRGRCVSVDVSPSGRLVAGGVAGSEIVYVFDASKGKLIRRLRTGQYSVYGLSFSPDSTMLATSGVMNTNIKIWKMPSPDSQTKYQAKQ